MKSLQISLPTFFWLIWRDIRVLGKNFVSSLIDAILLPFGWIFVSGYIMPFLGVPADYGSFMMAGLAAGMCLNSTCNDAGNLVNDLEGPKSISYELSLPLSSWLLCLKTALVFALKAIFLNIFIFPIGALLLWNKIDTSNINWIKFLLLYCIINLLFGFFSLTIALWVKNADQYWRFWNRGGWLLFIVGGFQFSWGLMEKAVPIFAYASLTNPILYPHEGMRAALLGQEGFLNYWVCVLMSILFTLFFILCSLKLFRKRLDCV